MRLTPLDIRKQEFRKGMRGLDADEVYAFLSTIADEYEAVINDNKAFRERLLELDDKVQEYRNMEKTLRDTLLTAERVTVEAKENANREADLIIKEAQIEAEKAVRDIRTTAMKLRQEIQELKQQRESYLSRIKVLVESHLKFVESAEKDFADEERRLMVEQQKLENDKQDAADKGSQPGKIGEILDRVIEQQKDALESEREVPATEAASAATATPTTESSRDTSRDETPPPHTDADDRVIAEEKTTPQPHGATSPPSETDSRPEQTGDGSVVAKDDAAGKKTVSTPGPGEPGEWSLERLKRDILAGSSTQDDKG
ncbi:MAG: DivIVA domain-containing protein [Candidatus Latescibacterota bacterium]|nr:MAG: DivIVA domain-containing protein [Candidatus Latescibacterota bacterium]